MGQKQKLRDVRAMSALPFKQTFASSSGTSEKCQKRTSGHTDTMRQSNYRDSFCPTREAITKEGAATRTVSVAAAAGLPAAFAS